MLCDACRPTLRFLDATARPLCAFDYRNNIVKTMLHAFKYEHLKSLDKVFAGLIFDFLKENKIEFDQSWQVSFVPMHRQKQNVRGFNQAELLAKELARLLGLECRVSLKKLRNTRPQMLLNREERLQNLKSCFEALPEVRNRKIILVDDVYTTGATFAECKQALLQSGAKKVFCLALTKDV